MRLFVEYLITDPLYFFSWILALTFSITFHEFSHAAAAFRLGDDTAARRGHLSFNPLVQMGASSIAMMLLVGIAWGCVPVNAHRLRSVRAHAVVALAGPVTNLLLCALFGIMAGGVARLEVSVALPALETARYFLMLAAGVNGILLLLNLLPLPMLDGWTALSVFWPRLRHLPARTAQTVSILGVLLIFFSPAGNLVWGGGLRLATFFVSLLYPA
ncbi:MAG TPA: site-2 protease family protein [Kiritimatiellae bacterium]|nr:site-2 protease family protein [Kiritimatiellia bacterium]